MKYNLDLTNTKPKAIYDIGEDFSAISKSGEKISFTNYYMCKNGKPFFGVSGEFHFSRMDEAYWEDEIIKMKMCGINVIATYVFWIHHEEEEGVFDFTGRRNVRHFIELCQKYGIYVILRVGPFDHGEVRNGGIPDWMYGKPFEVRQLNDGFLYYTKRLYERIAQEVKGLFFMDDGPIIGVQIDNEYMHSSSPWEFTNGVSNEWVYGGNEGDAYMLRLKELAAECGLQPVFYTCTGWGGAATPSNMMPLWGGYAFRPWLFYSYKGEHPSTEEYVYQDFHNNEVSCTNDFKPRYAPEERPYACCEMGGGMMCSYNYRFQLPFKSVDAMANIKIASGCNFLGYYVFQGGSNPVGKYGTFLNEGQVPKISYDYQAALGEFGQVRESYLRLKSIHFFVNAFADKLCNLGTILPEGASYIEPGDGKTLRYAVRSDGKRGFVFLNNYQDHTRLPDRKEEEICLKLKEEEIGFDHLSIKGDENCILPFHFEMQGIDLVKATAQPVTYLQVKDESIYVFLKPDGMDSYLEFEQRAHVLVEQTDESNVYASMKQTDESNVYVADTEKALERFTVEKGDVKLTVLCVSREMANQMYLWDGKGILFSKGAVLITGDTIRIESRNKAESVSCYPMDLLEQETKLEAEEAKKVLQPTVKQVGDGRYTLTFEKDFMKGFKDAILKINYQGDIGHAFIDGHMINDNFCNGATWEIGLKTFADRLEDRPLTIYITPLKEGVNVNVESAMAARMEEVSSYVAKLDSVLVEPVYETVIH